MFVRIPLCLACGRGPWRSHAKGRWGSCVLLQCPFLFFDPSPPRLVLLLLVLQRMRCSPEASEINGACWLDAARCHNLRQASPTSWTKARWASFVCSRLAFQRFPQKCPQLRERVGCACAAFFSNSISCAARNTRRLSCAVLSPLRCSS